MGSLSSGRRSGSANVKTLVEEHFNINCNIFNRKGLLSPGTLFYIDSIVGSGAMLSIKVQVQTDALHLRYRLNSRTYTQNVSTLYQNCHFGGKRPYFICPKCCLKRTALYLGKTDYFLCRTCQRYAYRSQRLNAHQRHANRAMNLKKKLISADQPCYSIERPKGMWTRTFDRILNQIIVFDNVSCGLFVEYFNGVVKKFDSQMEKTSNDLT